MTIYFVNSVVTFHVTHTASPACVSIGALLKTYKKVDEINLTFSRLTVNVAASGSVGPKDFQGGGTTPAQGEYVMTFVQNCLIKSGRVATSVTPFRPNAE